MVTESSGRTRAPRADAQRNRDHILDVAEKHFAQHGVTGSLDAIAKQAGVGAGTLYRHFPTREALLAALLTARDEQLVSRMEDIRSTAPGSAEALSSWLDALVDWAGAFDGLPEPLRAATASEASPLAVTCQGYITTTDEFLAAAIEDGSARPEVRGRDLFLAALATSWVRGAAMADGRTVDALASLTREGWSVAE
ncbi:TetR/AcrR family transcriptional regulator [Rhodococcus sp. NBC_00294]|uniref:TetR/AcrR family transcriptional regulator n=1 Tax=Rhodococcus sp. NBC_00294 TaxID=2976004 RepID=UPI002E2D92B5|nr:TetR family transcriptional regulator [Rhodococcus sp. NBC_00294]